MFSNVTFLKNRKSQIKKIKKRKHKQAKKGNEKNIRKRKKKREFSVWAGPLAGALQAALARLRATQRTSQSQGDHRSHVSSTDGNGYPLPAYPVGFYPLGWGFGKLFYPWVSKWWKVCTRWVLRVWAWYTKTHTRIPTYPVILYVTRGYLVILEKNPKI